MSPKDQLLRATQYWKYAAQFLPAERAGLAELRHLDRELVDARLAVLDAIDRCVALVNVRLDGAAPKDKP